MDFLWILSLVACATSSYTSESSEPWLHPRLPRNLNPYYYQLLMKPLFSGGVEFHGTVYIHIEVLNPTRFIILHAQKLNVTDTKVVANRINLNVTRAFAYEPNSYWVVETTERLVRGTNFTLQLRFRGNLTDGIGVYKDGYVNKTTGEFIPIVATSFMPAYTRLAFPNFDEPFFKSMFTIFIQHWPNTTAVSNMPVDDSWMPDLFTRITTFKKTPIINSFLVSFVVSHLSYRESTLSDGMTHRLWARPDRLAEADFAMNMTLAIQNYLNRELRLSYPPQKLDQFALPRRNGNNKWGLITYQEDRLLFDPIRDGEQARQDNLAFLAYKLAYNYFANSVTCRHWDHIWLNVGMATFYGLKGTLAADPTVYSNERSAQYAMNEDATKTSRALVTFTPINSTDVTGVLSRLVYDKGAAVLKMMESFLGVEPLRRGIRKFFENSSCRGSTTRHFWEALQEEIDTSLNISEIMYTWVFRVGLPVINIQLLPGNQINATQKRFLWDPTEHTSNTSSNERYEWYVPLTYKTKGGNVGLVWMNETEAVFDNLLSADDDWILFNSDQSGYYRVNYDDALWNRIIKQLNENHTVFTEKQRSNLIIDAVILAKAEQLGYDLVLNLTKYARRERSLLPWFHLSAHFNFMLRRTRYHDDRIERYTMKLTTHLMDELQVVDEGSSSEKLLRAKIMAMSCAAGHEGCIENTTRLFRAWIQNDTMNVVPANFRREVYCIGMAKSLVESSTDWNTIFERYTLVESEKERRNLLLALTCTKNTTLIDRFLEISIFNYSQEKVPLDDFKTAVAEFSYTRKTGIYLFRWVKRQRPKFQNRYYREFFLEMMHIVFETFNTEDEYAAMSAFIALIASDDEAARQTRRIEKRGDFLIEEISALNQTEISALNQTIMSNIRWMDRNNSTVAMWLQENT